MRLNYNSITGFIVAAFLFLGIGNIASAQIKIGTNGSAIAPSSILELESNNQGLLLPRLTDTISINTLNPPNGMIIYLTKWPAVGLYVRKTTGWEFLTGSLGGNGSFNNLTVGGTLIAQNFSGNLIGNASTATLANTASNAVNVNITNDLSTSTVTYPTFVTNTPGSTSIRTSSTKLSFVPNTGILTAIGFKGNLVGDVTGVATSSIDAVNASNTDVEDDLVSSLVQYPTFVSGTSGNLAHKTSSLNLTYTPLTGELAAKKFTGNLQGNASSATLATEANNSQTIKVTNDIITSAVSYPLFASGISGNQAIKSSSSNLSYVPSTGILTAKGFIGNLTGDVTGTVSNAKNAENAVNIQVKENAASAVPMYPTFVPSVTGPISATINSSKLKYIPATGEFIAPKFVGDLDGNASTTTTATNAANISVTDDSANPLATYLVFVNAITGNQAVKSSSINLSFVPQTGILTANGFVGNLTGNISGQANSALSAINANNALNATNSANASIVDENSSTNTFYPTFVGTASGNQVIRSSSSNLTYVPSTGILTAKKFVGNLVGDVTGKVSNAQLADNASNLEVAEIVPGVATYYPTLVSATTGQTSIKVNNSQLQYLPVAGELISPKFRGELIGNASSTTTATNAANVSVADDLTNNLPTYPIFVNSPTGNQSVKSSSTNLSYVPSTGILTAKGFVGNVVGNVTGQVSNAQNAENASKINIATNDISAGTVYPVFVSGLSGSLQPNVSTNRLGFKPLTGELTAITFKGDLIGNSFTATSANNATNSLNSAVSDDNSTNSTFFPVFVGTASGNQGIKASSANLKFNPSNGILTSTGFAGPLVGNVTGEASSALSATTTSKVSISTDDATAVTMYPTFVSGITGSLPIAVHSSKLGFKPAIGELTATVFKGDLAGIATNATSAVTADNALKSVIIDDASHSAVTYPIFVNDAAGNLPLRSNRTNLSYIPSSGTLTAKEFVGKLIGNVNGIATNAIDATNSANVIVTDDPASNSFKPLTFVDANTGNLPIKVSSKLRYNPFKDELVSTTFTGILNGNASTATTISPSGLVLPVNGGTGFTSYAAGEILFAESASTLKKLPIGPFGSVLRVAQPGGTGTPLVPSWATTGPGTVTEVQYGGTGLNSLTPGGVLIGNGTNNISTVSGSVGQVLRSNGPGVAPTFQNAAGGDMILANVQEVTGAKTFGTPGVGGFGGVNGVLKLAGVNSGVTILNGPGTGTSGVVTLPQEGILATHNGNETLTNKKLTSPELTNPDIGDAFGATLRLGGGTTLSTTNQTGTGKLVMEKDAQLIAPNIGAATGTSLNVGPGGTVTAGSFVGNLVNGSATLTDLSVNNTIIGNISGNAATVTTNANLTGQVTSNGNATLIDNNAVINKVLTGYTSASGVISATDNIVIAIGKLNGNIAANANATHTGDVTGATNLTISNSAVTTSKIAGSAVTLDKIQDVATNIVLGRATGGTGMLEQIATSGTGNVVRANSPTLITPNLGSATATSLTVSGAITSNIAVGNAPFVVTSTTPVTNLSIGGNSGSATKLATARAINGVNFDGTAPINIDAPALSLTGNTLNPLILTSGLTSVGTLGNLTVTNPIVGSVTGNASNVNGTVAIANGGTGATNQQTALNNLAGTQAAGRYLRSDGTNTLLSTILAGDVPTLNQNTTGTAAGLNDAYIDWNATIGGKAILNKPTLKDGTVTSVAALTLGTSGTDLSSSVATNTSTPIITLNVPTASATNRGVLSSANWTNFNSKQDPLTFSTGLSNSSGTVTVNSTQNITNLSNLSSNGIVTTSGNNGALTVTPVNGTGNVVLTSDATLVNPNIGTANGSSLTLTGSLTSTATTGTAPFVVSSTTPVANLNIGGNAASATKLATARAINGIDFDGTASITISSAASTLTGNTLNSSILNSNLTSVGILGSLSVTNPINGSLAGNAATATKLVASRTIYGNIFDGTANLDQVIAPGFGGTGNRFTEFVGPLGSIKKFTLPDNDAVLARTDAAQTFNGVQTFSSVIAGSINGNAATATTASGLNPSTTITSPNLITPLLGTATATSINKVLITGPVVSATLNLAEASTLATSGANSITLTSTGATNVTLPTSGILVSAISASGIIDFTAVNANDSTTRTITVTGASDGDAVSLGVPSSLAGAGGIYTAWVSAPDTVTVKFSNTTAVLIDPASATIKIKVLK